MSKPNENTMAMIDFPRLIEAKQMAMALMDEGVQFTFCPQPLSISYPMKARGPELLVDQVIS
jgi:hypothetical protein